MQPNKIEDIANIINSASTPIAILVVAEGCENYKSPLQDTIEEKLNEHAVPVVYYGMCIPEHMMGFPRAQTPCMYYFVPNNQTPVFWRFSDQIIHSMDADLNILSRMTQGMTYEDARFSEDEKTQVMRIDYLLEQEKESIKSFPSVFQQARNLASELWKTSKLASRNLPIIVPAEVGFARISECQKCEHLDAKQFRCTKCGCFMKTKTQLASASCPIGKWSAHINTSDDTIN